ncbi:MAG: DUF6599 family protein [Terracidiphilus sp.]
MIFAEHWKAATAVLALATVVAGIGCRKVQVDPFPQSGAIAGWQKTSDTRVYAAKDLWQYIDGDADQYVSAGVISVATSEYKYRDAVEAVVDVYKMSEAAGAHKIFAGNQSTDGKSVALGDEAISHEQSVIFRKGSYLVRIVAYESTPDTGQALLGLARGVASKL